MSNKDEKFFRGGAEIWLNYMRHNTDYDRERYRVCVRLFEELLNSKGSLMLHGGSLGFKAPYNKVLSQDSLIEHASGFIKALKNTKNDPSLSTIIAVITTLYTKPTGNGVKYFIISDPNLKYNENLTDKKISRIWRDVSQGRGSFYSRNVSSDRIEKEDETPGRVGLVKKKDYWKIFEVCQGLGTMTVTGIPSNFDMSRPETFQLVRF